EYQVGEGLIGWIAEKAQPLRADDAEADPRFLRRPDMVEKMGSFLGAPLVIDGTCIGVISAVDAKKAHFTARHEELLELIADLCGPHIEVARLSRLAQLDALTGAFNRRGLDMVLPETRAEQFVSLVAVDIDHFKAVNDQHGHPAGDEVLKRLARVLVGTVREGDAVVRMGGEEFLLVLPGLDVHQAARIAERTRATVEQLVLKLAEQEVRLTISLGVTQKRGDESRDAALARADAALYQAKQSGRNRVQVAGP
ncbi:MAG: sensor domain-containing diguanylate cyclase, partial [Myxococcaceae bacterium]